MAWAWKSGPVSMRTLWPSQEMRMEGRVRRLRGVPAGGRGGFADGAVAAEGGHAHGGAAAEEGKVACIRGRILLPGISAGGAK